MSLKLGKENVIRCLLFTYAYNVKELVDVFELVARTPNAKLKMFFLINIFTQVIYDIMLGTDYTQHNVYIKA